MTSPSGGTTNSPTVEEVTEAELGLACSSEATGDRDGG